MTQDVIASYMQSHEGQRLTSTLARRVEYIITIENIEKYCKAGMEVLDVGCGEGIYSCYLAKLGMNITAVDLVPRHIEHLKQVSRENNYSIKAFEGNAIDLSVFCDACFDVVLCFGPLYHLVNEEDQKKCISECIRVTKSNGMIIFAYISPYSVYPCVLRGDLSRCSSELVKRIIDDKKIMANDPYCFWTDNYYYSPDIIEKRLKSFNLEICDHLALDGQSIAFQSVINSMNKKEFENWLEYHRKICRERSILGASNHGLIVTKKGEICYE